jgi:putative ABC transport system permease protein
MVAGRKFDPAFNDSLSIIVNENAVKAMGVTPEAALGLKYQAGTNPETQTPLFNIVGVVADYNFYSLHSEIGPLVIFNGNTQFTPANIVIRVNSNDIQSLLVQFETRWNEMAEQPFNYSFLDQDLQSQYISDQNTAIIFNIFTYIAIIMSCVGLFGLATYVVNQRSKEMSIRKVLGASVGHIILVFSREFMLLIAIAFVIGAPIAYLVLDKWLINFAYHVDIGIVFFVFAGAVTMLLVFITVSYQALKIARVNPVKMLRSE